VQKNVVRFRATSPESQSATIHNLKSSNPQEQTHEYILEMIGQLATLARDQGDPVLAAMLREVLRRQGRRRTTPRTSSIL
jgi:hypothetical protein